MMVVLDEKVSEKVVKLANEVGLTPDEMTQKIIEWYFEDSEKSE